MYKLKVEELYDSLQEKIVKDISEDEKLNSLWKEINELDELLKNTISKEVQRNNLKDFKNQLSDDFIKINRSCVINKKYAKINIDIS